MLIFKKRIFILYISVELGRNAYFDGFLNCVVDDVDNKDDLTDHDKEICSAHVSDQFDRAESPGRDCPSGSRELDR